MGLWGTELEAQVLRLKEEMMAYGLPSRTLKANKAEVSRRHDKEVTGLRSQIAELEAEAEKEKLMETLPLLVNCLLCSLEFSWTLALLQRSVMSLGAYFLSGEIRKEIPNVLKLTLKLEEGDAIRLSKEGSALFNRGDLFCCDAKSFLQDRILLTLHKAVTTVITNGFAKGKKAELIVSCKCGPLALQGRWRSSFYYFEQVSLGRGRGLLQALETHSIMRISAAILVKGDRTLALMMSVIVVTIPVGIFFFITPFGVKHISFDEFLCQL
uniref:Uncharacterized protein n=1 Tax=Tanacetum cinerariifolium TaxID=118510 RepID=A0A6L2JWK0_TANCI|nr:hypothetical protein [Tanacetum cinerariifolium]